MCCRYYLAPDPDQVEAINRSALADRMRDKLGMPLTTAGEIRPTDIVPAFAPSRAGSTSVFPDGLGFLGPRSAFQRQGGDSQPETDLQRSVAGSPLCRPRILVLRMATPHRAGWKKENRRKDADPAPEL